MLTEQASILLNDAVANNLTNQMTDNSMDLRLHQKYSSNEINEIHFEYAQEEEMINNQIDALDEKSGSEYQELMDELKELKDEEDDVIARKEEESSDYETGIQLENDQLETRLEAIRQDNEGLKECLQQNIERTFGYFQ